MKTHLYSLALITISTAVMAGNNAVPEDFGISATQYRISETNYYINKHLEKAGINEFAALLRIYAPTSLEKVKKYLANGRKWTKEL